MGCGADMMMVVVDMFNGGAWHCDCMYKRDGCDQTRPADTGNLRWRTKMKKCRNTQPHTCGVHFSADYPIPTPPAKDAAKIAAVANANPDDIGKHLYGCDCDLCQEATAQELEDMTN
jgi:hypothetical protein